MSSSGKVTCQVSSEPEDIYCSGDYRSTGTGNGNKPAKNTNASNDTHSSTIFDTPEFVIDAYLDAMVGESSKHQGIRILSDKYGPKIMEGNYNCNHNTKGECGCSSAPAAESKTCHEGDAHKKASHADSAKCPCADSIYETGEHANVEFPKKQCCTDENPYEEGESPFEEKPKKHICSCNCMEDTGYEYELGAAPYKKYAQCEPEKVCKTPKDPEQCDPNGPCKSINYTSPCSGKPFSEFEMEGGEETGSMVISNLDFSSNNLDNGSGSRDVLNLPLVQDISYLGTASETVLEDNEVRTRMPDETVEEDADALADELSFLVGSKDDDARSCALC